MSFSNELEIIPIPAFQDNYIWLLRRGSYAAVVDPGDAKPILDYLSEHRLFLTEILVTHYHADHIGGIPELINQTKAKLYASAYEPLPHTHTSVSEGDDINLTELNLKLQVMHLPGHTLGHVAYYNPNLIFCGDTLFGAGCGRLFEGTPAQMLASLHRIAQLPTTTQVYCTHEYTQKNIEFALTLEPSNQDLIERLAIAKSNRSIRQPTLPSNIDLEIKTNPFLRCTNVEIIKNSNATLTDELTVFSSIRALRNHY